MANERQTLSLDPSLKARLIASAASSREALSPHACRLIEAGLTSTQLIEQRDHRIRHLADELATTKTKLSQAFLNSQALESDLEAAKVKLDDAGYYIQIARSEAAEASRQRDQYLKLLGEANADPYRARDEREDHRSVRPIVSDVLGDETSYRRGRLKGALGGAAAALAFAFLTVVAAPSDSRFSVAVAKSAMGSSDREEAAALLHGWPLSTERALSVVYALLQAADNAKRLEGCFIRAKAPAKGPTTKTIPCTIQIPAPFRKYRLLVEPASPAPAKLPDTGRPAIAVKPAARN